MEKTKSHFIPSFKGGHHSEEAKQKLVIISKQFLKDEELALEAKKLGVSPPPPLYTKKQLEELRETANWTDSKLKKMTDGEAAKCMILYNNYKSKKQKAEEAGERAANEPIFLDEAKENGIAADQFYTEYLAKCT